MKAIVVYDSAYGNTEKVAQAMGEALSSEGEVDVLRAKEIAPAQVAGLDLLIVGSPTQKFTMLPSVKQFLNAIPSDGLKGVNVAAFDTRISVEDTNSAVLKFFVSLFGYAAKPIADRLQKKGGQLAAPPEGFYVEDTEGPMKEGELDRATGWAKGLVPGKQA